MLTSLLGSGNSNCLLVLSYLLDLTYFLDLPAVGSKGYAYLNLISHLDYAKSVVTVAI